MPAEKVGGSSSSPQSSRFTITCRPQLPRLLNPGALAAIEIGFDQAEAVTALLARNGLEARVANDLAGHPRALLLTCV